jgi:hypothetical protein
MVQPQLLHETVSHDTIECALAMAEGSKNGHIVGAVIGFLYKYRKYSVAVCGEAYRDPTWARGVIGAIEDELRHLIHERGQKDTIL